MKICAIGDTTTGCYWVRIKKPLEELRKRGHTVFLASPNQAVMTEGWDIVIFNNLIADMFLVDGETQEESSLVQMVRDFKEGGAKIVYDTDDGQDIMPDYIKNKEVYDKAIGSFQLFLQEANLVTCTTEKLAEYLRTKTNTPIKVLPNCIDLSEFPQRKKLDKIKIGFAGSPSHIKDITLVTDVIKKLKDKYDIYFEIFGLKVDGFKCKNPVRRHEYGQALADFGADIGICPLRDTEFNKYKSPVKTYEYSAVGTVALASNRLPYKGDWNDKWLVDDNQWYEVLERYILDRKLREQTQKEQQDWVLNNRDITKKASLWEEAYKQIPKESKF